MSSDKLAQWDNQSLEVVTRLLNLDSEIAVQATDDAAVLKKSLTGRFPFLEKANGVVISDFLPIARVLGQEHALFLGGEEADRQKVNMWCDHINGTCVPAAKRLIAQCNGSQKVTMDLKSFSMGLGDLRTSLASIESHLKLRNFLVGHSLTLADVLLVCLLAQAFTFVVDKKTRENVLPNTTRYVSLCMQIPAF